MVLAIIVIVIVAILVVAMPPCMRGATAELRAPVLATQRSVKKAYGQLKQQYPIEDESAILFKVLKEVYPDGKEDAAKRIVKASGNDIGVLTALIIRNEYGEKGLKQLEEYGDEL